MYGFKIRVDLPEKEVVYGYMQKDKKKIAGKLKFVLPTKVGEVMRRLMFQRTKYSLHSIILQNKEIIYALAYYCGAYNYSRSSGKILVVRL